MQSGKRTLAKQSSVANLGETLVDILQGRAERQSGEKAYTFLLDGERDEISLSYGELDLRAGAIAEFLIGLGLRGERALLIYPPGLDFIAGFFGCLYAGLIAVPAYPPEAARLNRTVKRLEAIVADAEAKVALTTRSVLSSLEAILAQAPMLGSMRWLATDELEGGHVDHSMKIDLSGDALAFLQYTSGSTGKPKGVMLTHSNLTHNAAAVRAFCEHCDEDKYVSWLPAFHDMGFMSGVLQPLYSGVPTVLLSPAAFLQRPFRWLDAISRYRATTSGGPNFAYDLCVRKIGPKERASLDLSSWTIAFNGAEPVRNETLERFAQTFEPCGFRKEALYPCYGLAEATLIVTGGRKGVRPIAKSFEPRALLEGRVIERTPTEQGGHFLVSCGHASQDQQVVIVQPETATRCRPGEVGEIWVSGSSVGQGYWKKPSETQETFDAYIADTREGPFLRTGDLGFLQGRELFVTGRLKDMLIIRGINHYPQDIELSVQNSHPALRPGCGAAFSVEIEGEEKLVAVQEVDDRNHIFPGEIIDSIRHFVTESHELQVYAAVLVKAGTIPKTSSGKIQRSACRKEFLEGKLEEVYRSLLDDGYSPLQEESFIRKALLAIDPRMRQSVAESFILEQAARVLRISPSRLLQARSLSALGLDSLMAIELKNYIEAQLRVVVPASKLLEGSSASDIALFVLNELNATVPALAGLTGSDDQVANEYPLSFTQKALWFFYQLAPESAAYNVAFAVGISSRIDVAALARAFQALVDCHPCLRTTFRVRDGQPVQRINRELQSRIEQVTASGLQQDAMRQRLTEVAYRPFNLERGPVYRASLFTRSPQEHILLLAVHHIVIDGWSFWVLLDELIELYKAEMTGARLLPASAYRYEDYVRWQAEMLEGEEGEELFKYWKQELSGNLPILDLPTLRSRPPLQTYSGASHGFELNDELTRQVKELAVSRDATLYMVLLAVFQILLHRHTGQDDILVGSPISARSRAEFEGIVGCFFNAVVLRADFSSDKTFREFLDQVRAKVLRALDHQEYPSHLLAERLQPVRDPSRPPLFQATFILQKRQSQGQAPIAFGQTRSPAKETELALTFVPIERQHARMELELEMIEADGAIHAWLHYNTDLFGASQIARMAGHFRVLLEGVVLDPDQRLSNLPLLTREEVANLLTDQTIPLDPYDYSGVEELFLQQVKKNPAKVAAVYNDSSITFDEVNRRSGQLASLISKLVN